MHQFLSLQSLVEENETIIQVGPRIMGAYGPDGMTALAHESRMMSVHRILEPRYFTKPPKRTTTPPEVNYIFAYILCIVAL